MKEQVLYLFQQHPQLAVVISLAISILIAVLGLVPSVFVTAANLLFFGFWKGTLISFAGEALGAAVAFVLYRYGFRKKTETGLQRFPKAQQLLHAQGREAFLLILSLRLLPFVPSGLVTFAAAVGTVAPLLFIVASSLGKIPALLLEAHTVQAVVNRSWIGTIVLAAVAVFLLVRLLRRKQLKT